MCQHDRTHPTTRVDAVTQAALIFFPSSCPCIHSYSKFLARYADSVFLSNISLLHLETRRIGFDAKKTKISSNINIFIFQLIVIQSIKWWLLLTVADSLPCCCVSMSLLIGQTENQFFCGCDVVITVIVRQKALNVCRRAAVSRRTTRGWWKRDRSNRSTLQCCRWWAPAADDRLSWPASRAAYWALRSRYRTSRTGNRARRWRPALSALIGEQQDHHTAAAAARWPTIQPPSPQSRFFGTSDSARQPLNERARDCDCLHDGSLTSVFRPDHAPVVVSLRNSVY